MEPFYPDKVNALWRAPNHLGTPSESDCEGRAVSFECAVRVRFFVSFGQDGEISEVRFVSNGCGWAVAASEALAGWAEGKRLRDLHALDDAVSAISEFIGEIPGARTSCADLPVEALRNALADHRNAQAAEWKGETALICTCFGVSEDTIEKAAASGAARTVEEIGEICRAGTGCGSCQMLIREILETARTSCE